MTWASFNFSWACILQFQLNYYFVVSLFIQGTKGVTFYFVLLSRRGRKKKSRNSNRIAGLLKKKKIKYNDAWAASFPVSAPVVFCHRGPLWLLLQVQILHFLPPIPSMAPSTAQQCKPAPCVRQQPFPLLLAVRKNTAQERSKNPNLSHTADKIWLSNRWEWMHSLSKCWSLCIR